MDEKENKAAEAEISRLLCGTDALLKRTPVKLLRATHAAILSAIVMNRMRGYEALSIKSMEGLYKIMGIDITWVGRNGKS